MQYQRNTVMSTLSNKVLRLGNQVILSSAVFADSHIGNGTLLLLLLFLGISRAKPYHPGRVFPERIGLGSGRSRRVPALALCMSITIHVA